MGDVDRLDVSQNIGLSQYIIQHRAIVKTTPLKLISHPEVIP